MRAISHLKHNVQSRNVLIILAITFPIIKMHCIGIASMTSKFVFLLNNDKHTSFMFKLFTKIEIAPTRYNVK